MLRWSTRCLPGFSILTLVLLLFLAFSGILRKFLSYQVGRPEEKVQVPLNLAQKAFVVYTVLIHINMFAFTLRLAWALVWVTEKTRLALQRHSCPRITSFPCNCDRQFLCESNTWSHAHASTDEYCRKTKGKIRSETRGKEIIHAIILPNYRENEDTLRTTLRVLASHPNAKSHYEIYLAMEEKEGMAVEKAANLAATFEHSFLRIETTFHPSGIDAEIAGKGSNVAFAARYIIKTYREFLHSELCNVVVTVIDADTHLPREYFTEIQRLRALYFADAERSLYCCPIIFDRNSHETPTLVRCADLLWGFAGISTMYPGSSIAMPTSVYSLPLSLVEKVGGWDSDPTAIGEDMHMLLKCYFQTAGNLITRTIYVPASQCNVSSDKGRACQRVLNTTIARYRQALRHMWGALDSGFAVRQMISCMRFNRRDFLLRPRHFILFHLLWEAHFLPCHVTLLLVFSALYTVWTPSDRLHPMLVWAFSLTNMLRTLSFMGMNVAIVLYDRWHKLCVEARIQAMHAANLSGTGFSHRKWYMPKYLLERVAFPIAGTIFGAVPTLHAIFSHFWTDRLEYRVSQKPIFEPETAVMV